MSNQSISQVHSGNDTWICSSGYRICVKDMTTTHLFNTVKMVWNHSAPTKYKLKPYKKYQNFGKAYTNKYMIKIIRSMLHELTYRNDLTESQKEVLCSIMNMKPIMGVGHE